MLKPALAFAVLLLASSAGGATTCDAIRTQIDAKIRAAGVQHYTLATVDAGANAEGEVVGTCDLGTRKIMYLKGNGAPGQSAAAGAPQAPADHDGMVTECKNGYVLTGGNCRKK
ncbi:MAG TPA: DUF1161 domain-containing protein [Rhodoferax sp.]|nr:DUF1161 domain-containing protein [Rhodoferax sp.]